MNQNEPTEAVSARLGGPQATDGESEGRGGERAADGREGLRERIALAIAEATGNNWPTQAFLTEANAVLAELQPELDALAALREGEQPLGEDQHPATASPAQWLWLWNQAAPEERLAWAGRILHASQEAATCYMERHPLRIQELQRQLDDARATVARYERDEAERLRRKLAEVQQQPPRAAFADEQPAPAHNAGPTVREAAAQDRAYWERKDAGEGQ